LRRGDWEGADPDVVRVDQLTKHEVNDAFAHLYAGSKWLGETTETVEAPAPPPPRSACGGRAPLMQHLAEIE